MPDPSSYQVLARKYRPTSFEQVVGQAAVVTTLENAIQHNRLHHAYLFSGTRGVGKTTLARLFARALNCAKGPTTNPCTTCDPCREIIAGSSMDVIEIDGASNRKVEDVDPLREAARYAPARDRYKIFIIDEIHMLSETAFNALLKILEEPPARTLFLFATTEPEEVPETILSRCLHLACRRVPRQEIASALERTAGAEKIQGTREAFDLLAGLASGSMRDALSLLDQAAAFGAGEVSAETIRSALGLIDRGVVVEFIEMIGKKDAAGVLEVIEKLSEAGADLAHFCREALARTRDMMVVKAAGTDAAERLGVEGEEAAACDAVAGMFSSDGLLRFAQAMLDLTDRIRRAEHPRYLLEAAALRMIRMTDLTPIEDLLRALRPSTAPSPRTDPGPGGGHRAGPSAASPRRADALSEGHPRGGRSSPRAGSAAPAERATGDVARVLERIAARKISLSTFLGQAHRITITDDMLVVTIRRKQGFLQAALQSQENGTVIREEATAVMGRPMAFRVEIEALAAQAAEEPDAAGKGNGALADNNDRLLAQALEEPVVRTAMDMFKGHIVDIREGR